MRRKAAAILGIGVGFAALGVALMLRPEASPNSRSQPAGNFVLVPPDSFCQAGESLSLNDLPGVVPYVVLGPNHDLANAGNVTEVTWCPIANGVNMRYSTGLQVSSWPNEIPDPGSLWNQWATEDFKGIIVVGAVRGTEGALADAAQDPTGQAMGGVEWVEGGITYQVAGDGKTQLSNLLAVAESMEPLPEPTPSPTPAPTPSSTP